MHETSGHARGVLANQRRKAGRPKGSKNKPKSILPAELAREMLLRMEGVIPDEHMRYLKGVVREGKAISTKQELDVLILLLNRNLWPALMSESRLLTNEETGEKEPAFRKDVTERLKVLNSLLTLRNQIEKGEKKDDADGEQPLLRIFADRSIAGRLGVLVGVQSSGVPGNVDGTQRIALPSGTVSDPIASGQESVPDRQQE